MCDTGDTAMWIQGTHSYRGHTMCDTGDTGDTVTMCDTGDAAMGQLQVTMCDTVGDTQLQCVIQGTQGDTVAMCDTVGGHSCNV